MPAKKRRKRAAGSKDTEAPARFPPLPRVPPPPTFAVDERQTRTMAFLGGLIEQTQERMRLAGPNFATGFHASAVDMGQLQHALGRGVQRLSDAQLEERWDEVLDWLRKCIRAWVQRTKMVKLERATGGVRVELQTQDDRGYYTYGFDVFTKRERESAAGDH
jgi:hypothetical protein